MSKDAEDYSGWSDALCSASDCLLLLSEVCSCLNFSISCNIHDFLKQCVHHAVHAHANVAAARIATGCILFSISALADVNIPLLWVPFSERILILIVLNLLGHDSCSSALIVVELNSILTNMRGFFIVILSGRNEISAT